MKPDKKMKINSCHYFLLQSLKSPKGDFFEIDTYLKLLYQKLSTIQNITSPEEFETEHAQLLAEIQSILNTIYTDLKKIKDPSVLKNPVFKALYDDFTKSWDPQLLSLADAAKESSPNDLANLLVFMENHGSDLYDFGTDIQEFLQTFPSN